MVRLIGHLAACNDAELFPVPVVNSPSRVSCRISPSPTVAVRALSTAGNNRGLRRWNSPPRCVCERCITLAVTMRGIIHRSQVPGRACAWLWLLVTVGCGGGIHGRTVKVHAEKPANVVVLFQLQAVDGPIGSLGGPLGMEEDQGPLASLDQDAFHVTEDGFPVGLDSEGFVTNTDLRSGQRIVLLLDLGGAISIGDLTMMGDATQEFLQRLTSQRVAIYAFDGSPKLHRMGRMTTPDAAAKAVAKIHGFASKDKSTNLHGSFVAALDKLRSEVARPDHMFGTGILVVVSRGPDRAARIPIAELDEALDAEHGLDLVRLVIGVGPLAAEANLSQLATWDATLIEHMDELHTHLGRVADRVDDYGRSYYVLSYCSAARADFHAGRIEISHMTRDGGEVQERTGNIDFDFDATGFRGGCKPTPVPEDLLPQVPQELGDDTAQ